MLAEPLGETQNGVEADATQPGSGVAASALGQVLGDGDQGLLRGAQSEQRRIGTFGKVLAAGRAAQTADALVRRGPAMRSQVALAALAIGGAIRVGTSQVRVAFLAH